MDRPADQPDAGPDTSAESSSVDPSADGEHAEPSPGAASSDPPDESEEGPGDGGRAPAAIMPGDGSRRPPPRRTGIFVDPADLREHVGGLLRAMLGSYQVDAFGNFSFMHDGARVFVTVGIGPMGPYVGVYSVTNIDLDLDEGLAKFLATTNHRLGFGTLSYDSENRAVWLRHTLLGTTLDAPELQSAVASVAHTAATIDDKISAHFGGRAFGDAPADVQDSTTPPTEDDSPVNVTGYL